MYQLSEKEYNYLQGIIGNQIACYTANYAHKDDELWSVGIFTIGKACAKYDPTRTDVKFTTYATSAIINEFRYWHRGEKKTLTDAHIDAEINENKNLCTYYEMIEDTKANTVNIDLKIDIDNAISSLKPREQEMIRLSMDGYTNKVIAERFGLSTSTVTRILGRVREQLAKELKELQYV